MSQRLVTTDDHTGAEILSDIVQTGASVTLMRNGQTVTWDGINLTDDSWQELKDMLVAWLPGATATEDGGQQANEAEPTQPAAAPALAERAQDAAEARAAEQTPAPAPAAAPAAASNGYARPAPTGGKLTQAAQKARSKAMRQWWYQLDSQSLKALGLPTPDRSKQVGKLPALVSERYSEAYAS